MLHIQGGYHNLDNKIQQFYYKQFVFKEMKLKIHNLLSFKPTLHILLNINFNKLFKLKGRGQLTLGY
jgi:hypothetical protein